MPPVRMRERGKTKKGTMKRILKQLFKLYPWQLILSLICLIFNVFGNISSSVFVSLATASLTEAGVLGVDPFVGTYPVKSTFGFTMYTNVTNLIIIMVKTKIETNPVWIKLGID